MGLEFVGDAICLSGLTGSKLKSDVVGEYYRFWWGITSGGKAKDYEWPTAIVELDAATGEVYIEDTKLTILGSAGHALDLKCSNPNTDKLKVILVERDVGCYARLKRVIGRRWSSVDVGMAEGALQLNSSSIYLLNQTLDGALRSIAVLELGNALFFFDPLRSVKYETIEKVARGRINAFYKRGTEFIIFLFTSDWFLGRGDFAGLPTVPDERSWSAEQKEAVVEADALFGDREWRSGVLNNKPVGEREKSLIEFYRSRLHKWFRYVLPLPFNPRANQTFHLILCSNFSIGVRAARNSFYCEKTGNPKYSPDNRGAFDRFHRSHPETFVGLSRAKRPLEWRILWTTIVEHEEGICDCTCSGYEGIGEDTAARQRLLEWLEQNGYLSKFNIENAWKQPIQQYKLNWSTIKTKLDVDPPPPLKPLSPKEAGG